MLPTNLKSFQPDQPKNSAHHKINSHKVIFTVFQPFLVQIVGQN
jgi:hypothetical protein